MSRIHFKQSVEELINSPISTSESSELVNLKLNSKPKTGLAEEGDMTMRGIITRILIFRANQGT
jgi:hypothetical protein